jgi:hypothetical protein
MPLRSLTSTGFAPAAGSWAVQAVSAENRPLARLG